MPPTNLFGLGYGVGPAGYGYPSVGRWSPLSLGTSLAAWYRADAGCFTDAACLFASASSQSASRASSAALQTGDVDFTICAWVKVTDILATYGVVSKGRPHLAGGEYEFFITTAGTVKLRVRKADDSGRTDCTSTDTVTAGTWAFIECYHDAAGDVIGVRVNNGTAVTGAHAGGAFVGTNAFAAGLLLDTGFMNGAIARVGFWKRLLTAGERTSLYNAGAGKFYADLTTAEKVSLVEYWNLCESSSTRVGSHAGLNLTPTNGPTVAAGPGEGLCVNNAPRKRINDQSGNARHRTQATITKQSLAIDAGQNGRTVGRYDGTDDFDQVLANLGAQPLTIFGALKTGNTNSTSQWDGAAALDRCLLSHGQTVSPGFQEIYSGTGIGAARSEGAFHVYEATYDGVASSLLVDGVSVASGDAGSQGLASGFTFAADYGGTSNSALDEGETFVVVGAMTAGQKASARAYLRARWSTP